MKFTKGTYRRTQSSWIATALHYQRKGKTAEFYSCITFLKRLKRREMREKP